ncbi:hypothetical protein NDU88_009355 [Pleurodeles waltl]|uniref:Uncharacterized protein n=1 Tax=Pleurodeles waltl TaxID=8319 RepID=A0AAV7QX44_PLEWA|nr:hypothetical protein NDU88_009355 [Pleurodeles waltl]
MRVNMNRAQTRTRTKAGARAGLQRQRNKLGMGSSIIGELVELADTVLEEGWDSLNGIINDKTNDKNTARGGAKRSNTHPVSLEYESEILGPVSTGCRDNPEMGQRKTEHPSENNPVIVVDYHQQNEPQTEAVQAN